MNALARTLHVLSLGLWFGTVAFFTLAGLLIFQAFEEISRLPAVADQTADARPLWFPVPAAFDKPRPSEKFPDPLRLEQGSRAAGVAVSNIFPTYYALQAGAALLALLTALALGRGFLSRTRTAVVALGLVAVLIGWGLEVYVSDLRKPRNDLTDAVLVSPTPGAEQIREAEQARATFGMWHGISLLVNFLALGLSAVGLALAAHLPARGTPDSADATRGRHQAPKGLRTPPVPPEPLGRIALAPGAGIAKPGEDVE